MSESYVFSLAPRESQDSDDDWDRYSENLRPSRRGRKIEALKRKSEAPTEAMAREKLDNILMNTENEESSNHDELQKILEFCSWFEQNFPVGQQKLYYELLWKVVSSDGFIERHQEDPRMLKIWERMADNSCGHAHEIYQFAVSRKSCFRNAALYVRWSQDVELAGAYVEARRVLILAKTNCATPLELINDAEDQLEMREMRRHMEQKDSDSDGDEEETRKAFTHLPVIGERHEVPIVRIPSICGDNTKKAMRFDNQNEQKIGISSVNEVQPFEVLSYADADDIEYLKNVHELSAHIERHAIKDAAGSSKIASTSAADEIKIVPVPTISSFEVWTIDNDGKKSGPKARMAIKRIFKDISFEEYAAQLPNHPAMVKHIIGVIDFDETL
ncbi:unnamed protein product [Caenorhabditis bovis]|uniref:BUB1 N-terminal domain-containing protein n=1 Tax=Caenorhabditis bovis TaxID=2654633 RepID=A0A8S1F856_9PELO|nr:unnamed protein product [Caenorhabditis bovis]